MLRRTAGGILYISKIVSIIVASFISAGPVLADKVNITRDLPHVDVQVGKRKIRIQRIQDTRHKLTGSLTLTSLPCPPRCIQPVRPVPGINAAGELEVIEFLRTRGKDLSGLLVDSRTPKMYRQGTIPGAINIPSVLLAENNPYQERILTILGATKRPDGTWDFTNVRELMLFCIGPTCSMSPRNIRTLVKLGYPPEKLHYYRNGIRGWQLLGFPLAKQRNENGED